MEKKQIVPTDLQKSAFAGKPSGELFKQFGS